MKDKLKVLEVINHPDGSATVNIEIGDELEEYLKKTFGIKELTEEFLKNMLTDALQNYSKKEE